MEKTIFNYSDYRCFLTDFVKSKKEANSLWSYGLWAKQMQLSDSTSITKILRGERHPGKNITNKFINYFKFTSDQEIYFKDLIQLHKVKKDPSLSVLIMERLQESTDQKRGHFMDVDSFNVISKWYCLAVREMVQWDNFIEDEDWMAKQFHTKINSSDIKKAIHSLINTGLLSRDPEGQLQVKNSKIHTQSDVGDEGIKRFHEQSLDNAKKALLEQSTDQREFSASCFNMDSEDIPAAKEMLRRFRSKFIKTFEKTNAKQLFQYQFQYYELTKPENTNENSN